MITRTQYIGAIYKTAEELRDAHRAYYGQFVTDDVVRLVLRHIGRDALIRSTDQHFNDIALFRWDSIVQTAKLPASVAKGLVDCGDYLTLAGGVCILKEAARQIVDAARDYVSARNP